MAKGLRNLNRARSQNYWIGLVAVFVLVLLTYLSMSGTNSMRFYLGKPLPFGQLDLRIRRKDKERTRSGKIADLADATILFIVSTL